MSVFVKGMGTISPQQSWNDEALLIQAYDYRGVRLKCVEPEYEDWMDPRQLRRMSRIIKMGITSALMALKDSKIQHPDGIITGTAYGCLEDTATFLTKLIEHGEEALNPTPFIQSTHNTIGSTIAMLLQCQGYNQTFAHSAFSFEHALLDACMHLYESPDQSLLVGAVDEITDVSHAIQSRFNIFRKRQASSIKLFQQSKSGTINGEGAAFFVLSGISEGAMASIEGVRTLYKPSEDQLNDSIEIFLREAGLQTSDVDLILVGKSGSRTFDAMPERMVKEKFQRSNVGYFKHLCGEYPTASAFSLWMAARILNERHIPETVVFKSFSRQLRHVLIFNAYFGTHLSLMLLRTCRDTI